jgi:hypothetical protein
MPFKNDFSLIFSNFYSSSFCTYLLCPLISQNYQTGEYLPACVGFVRGLLAAGLRQLTV